MSQAKRGQQQLAPDPTGHHQLSGGDAFAALQGDATAIGIEARHGAVLDQLMAGLAGGVDPVGHDPVAAHSAGGGLEQSGEARLRFQRETGRDLVGIEGLIGDALIVHDPSGPRDRPLDRLFIPAFAVEEQAVGLPQLLTGVVFFLAPEAVGLLGETAEHWVGIHLPEHPGFAIAAGFGVGQGLSLQQHHIVHAPAGQGCRAAQAGHAAANDHDGCPAGQGGVGVLIRFLQN